MKTIKFARLVLTFFVSILLALTLLGCGQKEDRSLCHFQYECQSGSLTKDQNGLPPMKIINNSEVIKTPSWRAVEHGVTKVAQSTQYGVAYVLLVLGIVIPGPLIIFLIPGMLTGRKEKLIEGATIFLCGIAMASLVSEAGVDALTPWVYACLVVPGALLFLWGLLTENESGKLVLVIGPTAFFIVYLCFKIYRMLILGVVSSAIFTALILLVVAAVLVGAVSRSADTANG